MITLADAQEASERHDGIGHLARVLVDHHPVDGAELAAAAVVGRRAFAPVRADQTGRLAGLYCGGLHGDSPRVRCRSHPPRPDAFRRPTRVAGPPGSVPRPRTPPPPPAT